MKIMPVLIAALVGALAALGVTHGQAPHQAIAPETAYQRVLRTNTLRCGYIPYTYAFIVDPNTKAMSGVFYDVVEEIGRLNHIKIEWTEELTWATISTALETGRVDAFCSGLWIETQNARFMAYSTPFYYNGISAYGRADETRFAEPSALNDPAVRFVTRDGGTPDIVARQDYPKAQRVTFPSAVTDGEMIENVLSNKADVFIYGDDFLADYMAHNPGKLKDLFPGYKFRVYPIAIGLPMLDVGLKNTIDSSLAELRGGRFIEKALQKYAPEGSWIADPSKVK
jgi:ABC-type amino acid transport substrate-binding protein